MRLPNDPEWVIEDLADVAIPLNVLIPLDGSRYGDRGILPGKRIANAFRLGVGVVEVVASMEEADRSMLDDAVRDEHFDWSRVAVGGDVAAAITIVAEEHDAMICMATHGHGRSMAPAGSIPEEVVRRSTTPVLLIGPGADVYEEMPIRQLVVAVDGTAPGEAVCRGAIRWAKHSGNAMGVHFVTVVQPTPEPLQPDSPSGRLFESNGDALAYVTGLVERFATPEVAVTGSVASDPASPASGLAQLLRDVPDALLVLGAHGRVGRSRLAHGSIAGNIVAAAPVPVMMFPSKRSRLQL